MKASELATALGSSVQGSQEDPELTGISTLSGAGPSDVSFVTDRKFLAAVEASRAAVILISNKLPAPERAHIPLPDAWAGVLQALKIFHPGFDRKVYAGVHPTAVIDDSAELGEGVTVAPNAVVGADTRLAEGCYVGPGVVIGPRCVIGANTVIYANAVIEAETQIGAGVYIQPGAVIGSDGFKHERLNGRWTKIPQVGRVVLADGAEVGANSCIDRASYDVTRVGNNTKIDNLVQIAHNAKLGDNCIVVAQTGVAGSTVVGNHTILAAQAGVADNLTIGEGVIIMAQAGVTKNVPDRETRWGTPAIPFNESARIASTSRKLPQLLSDFAKLQRRVEELEAQLAAKDSE